VPEVIIAASFRNLPALIRLDRKEMGVIMQTQHLARAAECLLNSVQSADRHEQLAMLKLAQVWLQRSEQREGQQPKVAAAPPRKRQRQRKQPRAKAA